MSGSRILQQHAAVSLAEAARGVLRTGLGAKDREALLVALHAANADLERAIMAFQRATDEAERGAASYERAVEGVLQVVWEATGDWQTYPLDTLPERVRRLVAPTAALPPARGAVIDATAESTSTD